MLLVKLRQKWGGREPASRLVMNSAHTGSHALNADLTSGAVRRDQAADLLDSILLQDDPDVRRVVSSALPPGFDLAELHAQWRANSLGRAGSPTAIIELLSGCGAIPGASGQRMVQLLLAAARELDKQERLRWTPLDFETLIESCEIEVSTGPERVLSQSPVRPQRRAIGDRGIAADAVSVENLTDRVRMVGLADSPFEGVPRYETFFESLCRALHRSLPRHVLLVREPGVAERAVLVELARRAALGRPQFLAGKSIVSADCRFLPADAAPAVAQELLLGTAAANDLIICLDHAANLLLAARDFDGRRALILRTLSRTPARVVAVVSPREAEELLLSDGNAGELLSTVELPEAEPEAAKKLVAHFARGLEAEYTVTIEQDAIDRAVTLSDAHVLHERLPYKAVKILRSTCDDVEYDRSQGGASRGQVTAVDVLNKVSQICGVPPSTLTGIGDAVDYRTALADAIVGQPHAVGEVATELGLIKAGMVDAGKPASVMMFIGQTGTGKTEMAKALARLYSASKRLKTFTLGNFSEPHSVSGIIGVPAGYVGHDQGGRLVNELNADPYGVFLLDEADKAHPDVMQPFLNLFDEGWVCDQKGTKAYANRAMFILTTNVGQRQIAEMCRNGKPADEIATTMKDTLAKIRHSKSNRPVFSPEFLARVKRIVVFRSLDEEAMRGICRRVVQGLQADWMAKRLKRLVIPDALIDEVGRRAFRIDERSQGKEGGRVVRKLLANIVEARVQRAIGASPQEYRKCEEVAVELSECAVNGDAWNVPDDVIRICFANAPAEK